MVFSYDSTGNDKNESIVDELKSWDKAIKRNKERNIDHQTSYMHVEHAANSLNWYLMWHDKNNKSWARDT